MTFNSGLQEDPEEVCQLLLGVRRVAGFALQPLQAQGVQTRCFQLQEQQFVIGSRGEVTGKSLFEEQPMA